MQRIAIALNQLQNQQIILTSEQQHYLYRVLRLQKGDKFIAMDGMGKWWLSQLSDTNAQILHEIIVETELPIAVTLMIALPKGNGFDEVVRCCTELGVSCIIPVISDRTLLKPSVQKVERWRRIAQEAAEQSERTKIPQILEPVAFKQIISSFVNVEKYICVARGDSPHLLHYLQHQPQKNVVIATGAEGGWTKQEVEIALQNGFQQVSLGNRILRAVTAPIAIMSLISAGSEV
ncbi:16S rRNA (uracil(1498)-N(3))-methyltransferase [Plectonema cf. radiosum LEGE 06105]|uniref:Ribosomal RNA small subunit methyltransferase E n=1 Tax=Plectonema cf. radiosum LEGE 06105 TaxID=945769 RepID=A0A8J7FCC1_9CYAN|nr:16S rRNA (uracil(1498)-N(3))-methyltransferase [Plectonema radiosum]MBE9215824.1 16S rRNA (uracil(1498)-N(3))-methyltransferase [Plectonema cf. radiosum LEGE 06105]